MRLRFFYLSQIYQFSDWISLIDLILANSSICKHLIIYSDVLPPWFSTYLFNLPFSRNFIASSSSSALLVVLWSLTTANCSSYAHTQKLMVTHQLIWFNYNHMLMIIKNIYLAEHLFKLQSYMRSDN